MFRIHITCPAKHTTYEDYETREEAVRWLSLSRDETTWYATKLEDTKTLEVLWELERR